jgi:hypothetical protein
MLGCLALAAACAASPEDFELAWEAANRRRDEAMSRGGSEPERAPASPTDRAAIGAQWLWASGKAMPGVALGGAYRLLRFGVEASLVTLTEPSHEFETRFLGNEFGLHVMVRPLYGKRWEIAAGMGGDWYSLWNIHGDLHEAALSVLGAGRFRFSEQVGAFVTARAYPLTTAGLELGTARDGSWRVPILLGTGIEWSIR